MEQRGKGPRACPDCGEALAARCAMNAAMRAAGDQVIAITASGCLEVFSLPYPGASRQIPWIHSLFGNAAAVASGVAAALAVQGRSHVRVIAQGGDGDTTDTGFGCLSGMFERNDDVLYICYDSEARTNIGKNVPLIALAHGIAYVATASVSDLRDLEAKITKAMTFRGARYVHILTPTPLGCGSQSVDPIKVANMAVQSGLFPLFEAEGGEITGCTKVRRAVPVSEYLKLQKRFEHLFGANADPRVARIQAIADRNIRKFALQDEQDGLVAPSAREA